MRLLYHCLEVGTTSNTDNISKFKSSSLSIDGGDVILIPRATSKIARKTLFLSGRKSDNNPILTKQNVIKKNDSDVILIPKLNSARTSPSENHMVKRRKHEGSNQQ